jgi:hypothetical protein
MADSSGAYRRLAEEFYAPAPLESLLERFSTIDQRLHTGEISRDEASQLKASAFRSMRKAAAGDPASSRGPILGLLLPHCLSRKDDEGSFARSRYRECLRDWLNDLSEPSRSELRGEVLGVLVGALDDPDPEPACWAIAVLGYRGPGVSESLWRVAEADGGEPGDVALDCLADLGVSRAERPRLLAAVHERARHRCTQTLVGAMWRLADPESIDTIEQCWLKPGDERSWPNLSHLIIRTVAEVLIERPDDSDLHDRTWSMIVDGLEPGSRLVAQMGPYCDSPEVIPFILKQVFAESGDTEQSKNRRYATHHRLDECIGPRQLEGWLAPVDLGVREVIWSDAARDTGAPGRFVSMAMRLKESSCKALLSMADPAMATASAFEELVGREEGTYARAMISELLACFRIQPLPPTAVRWVTERIDVDRQDSGDHLSYRTAAGRVLRSASTREAFAALSSFGITYDGQVLRQTTDALTDVTVHLALEGDRSVVDSIVDTVQRGPERHHRVAAAAALTHLAALNLLPPDDAAWLPEVLGDSGRDDSERSRIVAALGYLPGECLTPDLENRLIAWSRARDMLGWRSLEALAHHDRLAAREDLLADRLGLHAAGSSWDLRPDPQTVGGTGYILGLLFSHHPDSFLPAVCTFAMTKDWIECAALVHALDYFYKGPHPRPVHREVLSALVARIRLRQSRSEADLELFDFLGRWDRDTLVREPWARDWDDWMADARVALADSLGSHGPYDGDAHDLAIGLLLSLTGDGAYAVRRSAYRSLSRLSADSLRAFCVASSDSPSWDQRRRGAEACGWLAAEAYAVAYERFATDAEGPVRSEARRARKERRDRLDGERFLEVVLGCGGAGNAEVLRAWRYGHALQRVGDDSCLERLRAHVREQRLPGYVRHWLGLIEEGLEKRWREVTQKWPEPWLSLRGTIQEGRGTIRTGEAEFGVRYTVWKQPALTPSEYHRWGGTAWSSVDSPIATLSFDEADLELSSGERGRILLTSLTWGQITFSGQGPYPTRQG